MVWIEWPPRINVNPYAVSSAVDSALFPVVASLAQALHLAEGEGVPIPLVGNDVIHNCGGCDPVICLAETAKRLRRQLGRTARTPMSRPIPRVPWVSQWRTLDFAAFSSLRVSARHSRVCIAISWPATFRSRTTATATSNAISSSLRICWRRGDSDIQYPPVATLSVLPHYTMIRACQYSFHRPSLKIAGKA